MPEQAADFVLTEEETKVVRFDRERIEYFKSYRRRFEEQMRRGARVWNLIADPAPRDDISNIFIGIARMVALQAIASMTEGRPYFGFRPGASSDRVKIPIWDAAVNHILNMSNFDSKQFLFFTDHVIQGMGIYDVVPQYPLRKIRIPRGDGTFEERVKRDFRREKVEVRQRSPFEVWLDPCSPNLEEVQATYDEMYIDKYTWEQDFVRAILPTGEKRYKNTDRVQMGKTLSFGDQDYLMYRESEKVDKIVIGRLQDEINDVLRLYANGVPIYDGPLQIKELEDGTRTSGMNVLGKHSFCFGPNEHQYDGNLVTHALYPMGLPHVMRGFDALYQILTNMTIDNLRLTNTVALSYEPLEGSSGLDLDSRDFYSGDIIDGKLTPQAFGQSRLDLSSAMWNQLDNWCIYLTGVNFKQIFGEGSRTAFELSQRIRAQNKRFEHKIKVLEAGCLKKLGQLCLAGAMSELTVEDYEDITEKDIATFQKKIREKEATGEDFETEGGRLSRRKQFSLLRVPKRDLRESFTLGSKRLLRGGTKYDSTLVDGGISSHDSFIPSAPEYVWSIEYAERNAIPDVYVEGSRMLGDHQDLQFAKVNALINLARARVAEDPQGTLFDLAKLEKEYIAVTGVEEDRVTKEEQKNSDQWKIFEEMKKIILSPSSYAESGSPSSFAGNIEPSAGMEALRAGALGPGSAGALPETEGVLTSPLQRAAAGAP